MLFKEAVSSRILELCDKFKITPHNLANLSGVAPSTLRAIVVNEVNNPSSYVIYKICQTFKIELKDFYNSELFNFNNLDD